MVKNCTKCGEEKALDQFLFVKQGKSAYRRAECRKCGSARVSAFNKAKRLDPNHKSFHTMRKNSAKRQGSVKQATPQWLTEAQRAEIQSIYDKAKSSGLEVHHIEPIRGKLVCGLHVPWNLQQLSAAGHRAKHLGTSSWCINYWGTNRWSTNISRPSP